MEDSSKTTWFIVAVGVIILAGVIIAIMMSQFSKNGGNDERVEINIENNYQRGKSDAKIKVVEFSDFQCPACRAQSVVLKEIEEKYPDDVAVVYKHYPLNGIHEYANTAALAAEAAGAQGMFFEFHDILFAEQPVWSKLKTKEEVQQKFTEYAEQLGIGDIEAFTAAVNEQTFQERITKDIEEGDTIGIEATPTIFVNGKNIEERTQEAIEMEIQNIVKEQNGE